MADEPRVFERVAIVGIGLIGSSMALAARRGGCVGSIVAYDASPGVRARVRALGLADLVAEDPPRRCAAPTTSCSASRSASSAASRPRWRLISSRVPW